MALYAAVAVPLKLPHYAWQCVLVALLLALGGDGLKVGTLCSLVVSAAVKDSRALPLGQGHPTALRQSLVVNPCEDEGSGSSSSSTLAAPTPHFAVRVGGSAACSWR